MASKTVVLMCGNAGWGKDTAADMLVGLMGGPPTAVKMAYADPLKDAVNAMVGIPKEVLYGTKELKESFTAYGKTARHWLQWLGIEIGRNQIHADLWVHRFADRIIASTASLIVCSDCRFKDEIDVLRQRLLLDQISGSIKVIAVRVKRPGVPVDLSHQSESEIYYMPDSDFDAHLLNDGTLDVLRSRLVDLAALHLGRKVDEQAIPPV